MVADDSAGLSRKEIENLYIDAKRRMDGQEHGLAQRPERDLRTQKRFASLREEPWKLMLAVEMAHFARSQDRASQVWPVDSFVSALDEAGLALPEGLNIHSAIEIVAADLLRCAPATANTDAWFDVNIGRPMGVRLSSVSVGTVDVGTLDDGTAPGEWLRVDLRDSDLEQLTVLLLDVQAAPERLRARLDSRDWAARRDVVEGALALAERIAADALSLERFRVWLRGASDGSQSDVFASLIRGIASASSSDEVDIMDEYLSALSAAPRWGHESKRG